MIVAFLVGVCCLQNQATLPDSWKIYCGLLCGLVLLAGITQCARRQTVRFRLINVLILAFAGLTLGFTWSALLAERNLAQSLPAEWEGRDLTLTGTIDSLPDHFEQGVRFNFLVERVQGDGGSAPVVPQHVALAWYAALRNGEIQSVGQIMPGARWRLTVRLQRPHGNANPYGFDYEVWLLEQNLRATGYVRNAASNSELDPFVPGFGNAVQRCRDWLRARIMSALAGQRYAGVIVALVVGDQRLVSQADWQVFNRTGIGHLISISGLHITMVAGMFAALASYLWRRSFFTGANLPLQLPAQKFAALAGVLTALLYVLLAGFGVPAQRTLYMVAVVAAALWSGHLTSVSHVLCAALGVVLVLDPWAALWPGFWLSFGAPAHRCRGLTLANLAHHAA